MLGRSAILSILGLLAVGAANATELPASAKTPLTVPTKTPRAGGTDTSDIRGLDHARKITTGEVALSGTPGQTGQK
jgi:hypothetical protein